MSSGGVVPDRDDAPDDAAAVDVVVVGAGPCGLAAAVAAKRAGLGVLVIERSCVVSGIAGYPTFMTFFSTAAKLAIAGVPFVVATEKPTRRDALAYYRMIVEHFDLDVRQYETVRSIVAAGGGQPPRSRIPWARVRRAIHRPLGAVRFRVRSVDRAGAERETAARAVVVATGYFGVPNRLGVPGEDLPHVTHRFREGHEAFRRNAVVVGGGNSAVDAALELYRAGARVTIVHFGPAFDRNIKPWVLPDIANRVAEGSIAARWESRVAAITPAEVVLATARGEERVPADHVYLMLGYQPEVALLRDVGVPINPDTGIPAHDPLTMETTVPGIFIAGVIASGYDANKTFIENGRFHGDRIVARLVGREAPVEEPLSAELRSAEQP